MLLKDYPPHSNILPETSEVAYLSQLLPLLTLAISSHPNAAISASCNDQVTTVEQLTRCAENRIDNYNDHLESIGITSSEFVRLYLNIAQGDTIATSKIIINTEEKMGNIHSSINTINDRIVEPSTRHMEVIQKLLDQGKDNIFEYENGKGKIYPAINQEIIIISGPIASGKTEIYGKLYRNNGYVVIDLDVIRQMLTNSQNPDQKTIEAIRGETWFVSDLLLKMALEQGKSVLMQSTLHRIDRWKIDPNMIFAREKGIPIKVHMILRPILDCLIRNLSRKRSAAIGDIVDSMAGMERIYDFINVFENIKEVNFVDFYPYVRSKTGFLPKMFEDAYDQLQLLIKSNIRSDQPTVNLYTRKSDLTVGNEIL